MTTELFDLDITSELNNPETIAGYLDGCLEEGGITLFLKAMGDVARARGMSAVAGNAGLTRASLYKALSETGAPSLTTVDKVLDSMGFRLAIEVKATAPHVQRKASVVYAAEPLRRSGLRVADKPQVSVAAARPKAAPVISSSALTRSASKGTVMASKGGSKGPADFRNSETGRFVKEQYAKTHPKTTEKEHNRPSPSKKK